MIVGCDFLFYWIHRALHQPPFYKLLHKVRRARAASRLRSAPASH